MGEDVCTDLYHIYHCRGVEIDVSSDIIYFQN